MKSNTPKNQSTAVMQDVQRRSALKKIAVGTTATGAIATMPSAWIKPVVDAVILPAHASCTVPGCFPVTVAVSNLDPTPPSGGTASFVVEVKTTAPECESVKVVATVSFGEIVGASSGTIFSGSSLIFGWKGQGVAGVGIPSEPTILSIAWECKDLTKGTDTIDLRDLALKQAGDPPEAENAAPQAQAESVAGAPEVIEPEAVIEEVAPAETEVIQPAVEEAPVVETTIEPAI